MNVQKFHSLFSSLSNLELPFNSNSLFNNNLKNFNCTFSDDINLKLQRNPGNDEELWPLVGELFSESNRFLHNKTIDGETFRSAPNNIEKDDLKFTKNETIDFDGTRLYLLCGHIKELENCGKERNKFNEKQQQRLTEEEPERQEEDVCVLWNHVPEEITLHRTASSISYKFGMAVDTQVVDVRQEMMDGNVKFT